MVSVRHVLPASIDVDRWVRHGQRVVGALGGVVVVVMMVMAVVLVLVVAVWTGMRPGVALR